MRKLLTDEKHVYHMREYAIVKKDDGTHEYVAWDSKGGKLSWIRGEAKILEDVLALTPITSEGGEETLKTMKEVRKELKKLPEWWGKTKYYCVVLGQFAAMVKSCITGEPLQEEAEEYKMVQDILKRYGVILSPSDRSRDSAKLRRVFYSQPSD